MLRRSPGGSSIVISFVFHPCYPAARHSSAGSGRMDRESELAIVRRAYAKHVMAAAGVADRRVEAAFAAVRREHFLGPGPWPILRWGRGYEPSPSRDPGYLYDDVLVGIIPERNLNNGHPSFLAALIASGGPPARAAALPIWRGGR